MKEWWITEYEKMEEYLYEELGREPTEDEVLKSMEGEYHSWKTAIEVE